ncbi:MAG TPA: hypothetical protein DCZ40_09100 [Lachnospiraceae bacterium]|nr:hypothetical protein [Lachnospiraceae bacterium]
MKKANFLGIICVAAMVLPVVACGSPAPELTEEQNDQVVEYAAGLLLKYDENYHGRLVEEEEEPEEEIVQAVQKTETAAEEPEKDTSAADAVRETAEEDAEEEPEVIENRSIEEFYGIEGVTISYTGYEVKDTYPDNGEDDLFFAMNASDGCKLIILNFNVANISGQDKSLDMASLGTKFRISINGESYKYALTTMLLNDMSSYIGTIPAGGSENLVLVCEVPEENADSVQTVTLMMKNAAENAQLALN